MDINKFYKDFNNLKNKDISPNGIYLLSSILNSTVANELININLELRKLESYGYLDNEKKLTEKSEELLNITPKGMTYLTFLNTYRELFPKGKIFGYYKRDSLPDLRDRFNKFLKRYDYSYDLMLQATERYIKEELNNSNWQYLKSSAFVIEKKGEPSLLAKLCEEFYNTESNIVDFTD